MLQVVLYEPEIAPNAGNVVRLCVNLGFDLHLIEPLGFSLDDARVRRAGLDYHDMARVSVHESFSTYLAHAMPARVLPVSTRAERVYSSCRFESGDALLFGPETRGLPETLINHAAPALRLRIPMRGHSRSINLSNAVAIVAYEAWRQLGFAGAHPGGQSSISGFSFSNSCE